MFTGIVEELGRVRAVIPNADGARVEIDATTVLDDATLGASIAVNGCCLTVVDIGEGWFAADAVVETLRRTTLGKLAAGDPVNLERPLRLADRLGGHLVQGHVDGTGSLHAREPLSDGSVRVRVDAPGQIMRYVVHKGSITVDGISLTVAAVHDDGFSVAVIPHTLAVTTLGARAVGEPVNLECDVLAKYVERLVHGAVNEADRSELAGAGERPNAAPGIPAPSERDQEKRSSR
ncbi:MAG TPA: riboflavin synthase [Acidimicrobiia bacterium]|nr:riboflavin synthase [Acidimicrobiia bacterium]